METTRDKIAAAKAGISSPDPSWITWIMLRHLGERGAGGPRIGILTMGGRRRAWIVFLLAALFAVLCLASVWWNDIGYDWMFFWIIAPFVLLAGLMLSLGGRVSRPVQVAAESDALRNALLAADDLCAPIVVTPPALVQDAPTLIVSPLDDASARLHRNRGSNAGFIVFIGVMQIVLYFMSRPQAWQSLAVGAFFILSGLLNLARYGFADRPLTISADEKGLSWRRGLLRRQIRWHEVRALGQLTVPAGRDLALTKSPSQHLYMLLTQRKTLIWSAWQPEAQPSRRASRRASTTNPVLENPAEQLCAFITARTGIPLRDLSPAISNIVTTLRNRPRSPLLREGSTAVLAARYAQPQRRGSPLRWVALALVLALIVSALTVWVGEPRAYAAQLALAHASQPIFADSLADPSAQWPEGDYPGGIYSYADGGYQLARNDDGDSCCAISAWTPATYGDVVLEVTERQTGSYDFVASGLVLRADDQTHGLLVFTVSLDGEWKVDRIRATDDGGTTDETELAYHGVMFHEPAIHQGSGATNRLAVLMRGTSYAFFINDSFVGVYHDAGVAHGHVGIYTDGLSDSVTFSDFAVYPAPPPSPLLPV